MDNNARESLRKEISSIVGRILLDPRNSGMTCIPITLSKDYDVPDGQSLVCGNLGEVWFTRTGPNPDSPLQCNFYPKFSKALKIREDNNENYGDRLENVPFIHADTFSFQGKDTPVYHCPKILSVD